MNIRRFFVASLAMAVAMAAGFAVAHGSNGRSAAPRQEGMTGASLDLASQKGPVSERVAMAPQSDLKLLSKAQNLGPHDITATMKLTIGLKLRNLRELKRFLSQVQNPDSANYHQFLTPIQFAARYGPTQAQVKAVAQYLKQYKIRVKSVSRNHVLVRVEGTVGNIEHAFSIKINNYKLNGRTFTSTQGSPMLPRALSGFVLNILGLDNSRLMHPHIHYKPLKTANGVSAGRASGVSPHVAPPPATSSSAYFDPSQIAKAYDWPSITNASNGAGVSVAILTADTVGLSTDTSASNFWSAYGLPDHTVNVIHVDGLPSTDEGRVETLLDMEYSGAMGPGITQNVYIASNANLTTFADVYNQFVEDDTSQVMTTSWGVYESADPNQFLTDDQFFMQGAAEGISMFAAAGDNGTWDRGVGLNNADYPSSDPYVTSSNGTLLTISDISGTYGSETAWTDTGGAISQLFSQPAWQTGPGVPANGMLMNSDMALNSGGTSGHVYAVYDSQKGFLGVYGTSAVAPIFAGMFGIGVSQQPGGASLGQSNKLLYDDVNAGNYASDFHDVTSGCNGSLPDGSPSCAGTGWDHPTGWGSPNVSSLLSHIGVQGPAGTLSGAVTDPDGNAVSGALVHLSSGASRTTGPDGKYLIALPVGSYTVTVTHYGYLAGSANVKITDGVSTTQDLTLQPSPRVAVTGTVTDNSGHGYGLYADIKVTSPGAGQVASVWTDPATGKYSIQLPKGFDYTLSAAASVDGYDVKTATLSNLSTAETRDFALAVTPSCSAPGYAFNQGFGQDFNGGTFPPAGWTVTHTPSNSVSWEPDTNYLDNGQNFTGGTGISADADSGDAGYYYPGTSYDTSLITPPIPATSLSGDVILDYKANFQVYSGQEALDLDMSTDGGTTWTTISHWTTPHGGTDGGRVYSLPGYDARVDLTSYLPSSGTFQLRWRYYDPVRVWDWFAQIDDVSIGNCLPVSGGMVSGQVTDGNTGNGIVGASVSVDSSGGTKTVANADDPNLPVGSYLMFVPAGSHTFTAGATNYASGTATLDVANNAIKVHDFVLNAGKLATDPAQLTLHVMVNNQVKKQLTVSNVGNGKVNYKLFPVNAAPGGSASSSVPVERVSLAHPSWADKSLFWIKAHAKPGELNGASTAEPFAGGVGAYASPWVNIANLPIQIGDNATVYDQVDGKIYSIAGTNNTDPVENAVYAYDSGADSWSLATYIPVPREGPLAASINGEIYVTGGANLAGTVGELDIYDPNSNTWSTGAEEPTPSFGSTTAVLNGKIYIIGGVDNSNSGLSMVQVYNPATDSWGTAADYPHDVAFPACGTLLGRIYCAGGLKTAGGSYADGYVYDPSANAWSPIADLPIAQGIGGAVFAAGNGELVVAGGFVGSGASATNQVEAYDPVSNTWAQLPNTNVPVARGGGTCGSDGFYTVGSILSVSLLGANVTNKAQKLPGYACGNDAGIPWLTMTPGAGTVATGNSATVSLVIDGTGRKEFSTSKAYLAVTGNTPYRPMDIPLTVTWDPQPVALKVSGTIDPKTFKKGTYLTLDFKVGNDAIKGDGEATQTLLTVTLPSNMSFVKEQGSNCSSNAGVVACPVGDLAQGASIDVVIVAQASESGKYQVSAVATAREPQDNSVNNTTTVSSKAQASSGGGGSMSWPILVLLFGLAMELGRKRFAEYSSQ